MNESTANSFESSVSNALNADQPNALDAVEPASKAFWPRAASSEHKSAAQGVAPHISEDAEQVGRKLRNEAASLTQRTQANPAGSANAASKPNPQPAVIFHMAESARWNAAIQSGETHFAPVSLNSEGFIHLSTLDQVLIPANSLYKNRKDLLLLAVSVPTLTKLGMADKLIYEDCYASGMAFPHLYAKLPIESIVNVVEFTPNSAGLFEIPQQVKALYR